MSGSEGSHSQIAEHRQYFVSVAGWAAPSSVMHSACELSFTGAELRVEDVGCQLQ